MLESRGIEFEVIKYLEDPPSEKGLRQIVKMLGIKPKELARKGESLFKELGLGKKELADKEWITVLAENPKLIERPIVVHEGKAAIGRPTENIESIFDS